MPKLAVDVVRLRRLVLVAPHVATGARSSTVHRTMDASFEAIVDLHATRKHPDYLTNAIRYKGSPYIYTCTNDVDGLLGKRQTLVQWPTQQKLEQCVGASVGAVVGTTLLVRALGASMRRRYEDDEDDEDDDEDDDDDDTIKQRRGGRLFPLNRWLSARVHAMPFSSYGFVTDLCGVGRWHVFEQYDQTKSQFVLVVVAPLMPERMNQAQQEVCAIRLQSARTQGHTAVRTTSWRPDAVDVVVVRGDPLAIRGALAAWTTLTGEFLVGATDPAIAGAVHTSMWPQGLTVQSLNTYNADHDVARLKDTLTCNIANIGLPTLALTSSTEASALRRVGDYTAILPINTPLARLVCDNVVFQWTPLSAYRLTQYVHRSSLHANAVYHVLAFPIDPLTALPEIERTVAKTFVDQARATGKTLFKHQFDTLTVPTGHTRYLFVFLCSARIDHTTEHTVQLHHIRQTRLYTAVLPTMPLHAVANELQVTRVGGEGFAFRPTSPWHSHRVYEHIDVNRIQAKLYDKTKGRVERAARRLKAKHTVKQAEQHAIAKDIAEANLHTRRKAQAARRKANEAELYALDKATRTLWWNRLRRRYAGGGPCTRRA